jgi:hypothetical protein
MTAPTALYNDGNVKVILQDEANITIMADSTPDTPQLRQIVPCIIDQLQLGTYTITLVDKQGKLTEPPNASMLYVASILLEKRKVIKKKLKEAILLVPSQEAVTYYEQSKQQFLAVMQVMGLDHLPFTWTIRV